MKSKYFSEYGQASLFCAHIRADFGYDAEVEQEGHGWIVVWYEYE